MRPVKSRHTAIERLAPLCPSVKLRRISGGRYRLRIDGGKLAAAEKDSKHTLAFLADLVMYDYAFDQEEVMAQVRWVGNIPTRGLSAWQEHALRWLRGE